MKGVNLESFWQVNLSIQPQNKLARVHLIH